MYPTTVFELVDNSAIVKQTTTENIDLVQLLATTCQKGPEDLRLVSGDIFYKLYGTEISMAKHGQPLLQAANVIDNGGALLIKRLVSDDATLANLAVFARVIKTETQKTDAQGNLLYIDHVSGNETTDNDASNDPAMKVTCTIKYECQAAVGTKTISEQYTIMQAKLDEGKTVATEFLYPLFIIADNGRGASQKRIKISPEYADSKYKNCMKYRLEVIENNTILETLKFTFDPNYIENNLNKSLQSVLKAGSYQLTCKVFEKETELFIDKVAEMTGLDSSYLLQNDIFFGKTKSNQATIENLTIDLEKGFNLSYVYGIDLTEGSNGKLGNYPFGTQEYTNLAVDFFSGKVTPAIYDLYNTPIDLIVDANYPKPVKKAIEDLVIFREDCLYMRDSGIGLHSLEEVVNFNADTGKSKFISPYHLAYNVIDPYTKKEVTVTVGYSLSRLMIEHFKSGRNRPIAGSLHSMVIPEAIENTINYNPSVTPTMDEKTALEDVRVNYAAYYNNMLTLETFYTTLNDMTQLSYANNILAIQEVMKAIRKKCPMVRYSFITGDDLSIYEKDVNAVITKYAANFESIEMQYVEDADMIDNKVYYAVINVRFKNFVQSEKFKIIALPTTTSSTTAS